MDEPAAPLIEGRTVAFLRRRRGHGGPVIAVDFAAQLRKPTLDGSSLVAATRWSESASDRRLDLERDPESCSSSTIYYKGRTRSVS